MLVEETEVNIYEKGFELEHSGKSTVKFKCDMWDFRIRTLGGKSPDKQYAVECIGVNAKALAGYLIKKGFRQFGDRYFRIVDNVVYEQDLHQVHDFALKRARKLKKVYTFMDSNGTAGTKTCGRESVLNATQSTLKFQLNLLKLQRFDPNDPEENENPPWLKDTIDSSYIFFSNTAVKITVAKFLLIEYSELDGLVWSTAIKPKDFTYTKTKCEWIHKFFDLAIGKKYYKEIYSAIGFMLHNYMSDQGFPILICVERELSELNNGGNGKDFFGQILGTVRKRDIVNGRQMIKNDKFNLQTIKQDTQLVWFRDMARTFNSDEMYNYTEGDGIEVSKKYMDPFNVRAKIGMSLQHTVGIEDASAERRIAFMPFTNEIGKIGGVGLALKEKVAIFSNEWKGDWNVFYSFIINCIQFYLKNGLIKMDNAFMKEARIDELNANHDFSALKLGAIYTYEEGIRKTMGEYADVGREPSLYFKSALEKWCKNMGYIFYNKERKNKERAFRILTSPMKISKQKIK